VAGDRLGLTSQFVTFTIAWPFSFRYRSIGSLMRLNAIVYAPLKFFISWIRKILPTQSFTVFA
jgi:hypothetical protein